MRVYATCPKCKAEVTYIQRAYLIPPKDVEPERCACGHVLYDYQEAERRRAAYQADREARGDTSDGSLYLYRNVAVQVPTGGHFGELKLFELGLTDLRLDIRTSGKPITLP